METRPGTNKASLSVFSSVSYLQSLKISPSAPNAISRGGSKDCMANAMQHISWMKSLRRQKSTSGGNEILGLTFMARITSWKTKDGIVLLPTVDKILQHPRDVLIDGEKAHEWTQHAQHAQHAQRRRMLPLNRTEENTRAPTLEARDTPLEDPGNKITWDFVYYFLFCSG